MKSKNKRVTEKLLSKTKIYIAIIIILLMIICIENMQLLIPSIFIFIITIIYSYYANSKNKSQINETLQDLTLTLDSAAKTSLVSSPFPLIIIETNGNITWKNDKFVEEFKEFDVEAYLKNLVLDIKSEIEKKQKGDETSIIRHIEMNQKYYEIVGKFVNTKNTQENKENEYIVMLYFIDETENIILQNEYKNSKSCVTIMMIDNYEETMQQMESEEKAQIIAQIDKVIYDWTDQTNGVLIKSDRDKYIYLFKKR